MADQFGPDVRELVADRAIRNAARTPRFNPELRYGIAAAVLTVVGIGTCVARAEENPAAPAIPEGSSAAAPDAGLMPAEVPSIVPIVPLVAPIGDDRIEAEKTHFRAFLRSPNGQEKEFDVSQLPSETKGWQFVIECDFHLKDEFCYALTEEVQPIASLPVKRVPIIREGKKTGERKLLRFTLSAVSEKTVVVGKGTMYEKKFEVKSVTSEPSAAVAAAAPAAPEATPPVAVVTPPDTTPPAPEAPAEAAARAVEPEPSSPPTEWSMFGGVAGSLVGRGMGNQPDVKAFVGGRASPWAFGKTSNRLYVEAEAGYAENRVAVAEPGNGRFVNPQPHVLGRVFEGGVSLVGEKGFREGKRIASTIFGGVGVGAELFTSAGRPDIAYDRDFPRMLNVAEGSSGIIPDVRARVGGCLQLGPAEVCAGLSGQRGLRNVPRQAGSPNRDAGSYDVSVFTHAGYRSRKWR